MKRYRTSEHCRTRCIGCGGPLIVEINCDVEDVRELNVTEHMELVCENECDGLWLAEEWWQLKLEISCEVIRQLKSGLAKHRERHRWQEIAC